MLGKDDNNGDGDGDGYGDGDGNGDGNGNAGLVLGKREVGGGSKPGGTSPMVKKARKA